MPKNPFEKSLHDDQRTRELRDLNEALRRKYADEGEDRPPSAKLAEAILRARSAE